MASFNLYGDDGGLKFDDLVTAEPLVLEARLSVVHTQVVGINYFQSILEMNGLNENSKPEEILSAKISDELLDLNKQLVTEFRTAHPVAVRSSAKGERGGTGIYKTVFIVPKDVAGNIRLLWEAEKQVYASEFTADARAYRKKHDLPIGMALMIQLVVGQRFGKYFCPFLAGSAYVSYKGKRLIRVIPGLGTKAVESEAIVIQDDLPTEQELSEQLRGLGKIEAINLNSGKLEEIDCPEEINHESKLDPLRKLWRVLWSWKSSGNFYLEWATPDNIPENIKIVQMAPFEDKALEPISIDTKGKIILAEGTDIVNHGIKKCQTVVRCALMGPTKENLDWLSYINEQLKDYLLIAPQTCFSMVAQMYEDRSIKYAHFSNAAALLETQYPFSEEERTTRLKALLPTADHTKDRGGQHFQQICDREDILFIGAEADLSPLTKFKPYTEFGRCVRLWKVPVEVVNDVTAGKGTIYLCGQASPPPEYSVEELQDFVEALRSSAIWIEDNEKKQELASAFYDVCYVIIARIFEAPIFINKI